MCIIIIQCHIRKIHFSNIHTNILDIICFKTYIFINISGRTVYLWHWFPFCRLYSILYFFRINECTYLFSFNSFIFCMVSCELCGVKCGIIESDNIRWYNLHLDFNVIHIKQNNVYIDSQWSLSNVFCYGLLKAYYTFFNFVPNTFVSYFETKSNIRITIWFQTHFDNKCLNNITFITYIYKRTIYIFRYTKWVCLSNRL